MDARVLEANYWETEPGDPNYGKYTYIPKSAHMCPTWALKEELAYLDDLSNGGACDFDGVMSRIWEIEWELKSRGCAEL
jgi:hypothetical protein